MKVEAIRIGPMEAIRIGPVETIRIGPVEDIRSDTDRSKRIYMTKYISSNQIFFFFLRGEVLRLIETYDSLTAWQIMKDEK